jgi:hypothetical protein
MHLFLRSMGKHMVSAMGDLSNLNWFVVILRRQQVGRHFNPRGIGRLFVESTCGSPLSLKAAASLDGGTLV